MTDLPVELSSPIFRALEQLQVEYMLVGSVASSMRGVARSTMDADVVANLQPKHLKPLVAAIENDFYVSLEAAQDALRRSSMFNVVHFGSGFKVDIYVLGPRAFDREEFRRREQVSNGGKQLWVATSEDLILSKLDGYKLGNRISERQWRDVAGIVQILKQQLDVAYIEKWAKELDLLELWNEVLLAEGGLEG